MNFYKKLVSLMFVSVLLLSSTAFAADPVKTGTVAFEDGWFRGGVEPRRENSAAVAPGEINAVGN